MRTVTIANQTNHYVTIPEQIFTTKEIAHILISSATSAPKGLSPEVFVTHVKNLVAPNTLFMDYTVQQSVREYGRIDALESSAHALLKSKGFSSPKDITKVVKAVSDYVEDIQL